MKLNYQFSNLLGKVYDGGNLVFSNDGNSIVTSVGRRITVFDLVNNTSTTLNFLSRDNVVVLALSSKNLLIAIDENGRARLINFNQKTEIGEYYFKYPVKDAKFSPDGKYLAATVGSTVIVYRTPNIRKEFNTLIMHRQWGGHKGKTTTIGWSKSSRYFLVGGEDLMVRVYDVMGEEDPYGLVGHNDAINGAWFTDDMKTIYVVTERGRLYTWKHKEATEGEEPEQADSDTRSIFQGRWVQPPSSSRNLQTRVTSSHYHDNGMSSLLFVGYKDGSFGIYNLPDFSEISLLRTSSHKVSAITANNNGSWIGIGSKKFGQLLVWEWQSETYIIKQQGHTFATSCIAYSPDGQTIATGDDEGKVKLWSSVTGLCFVTFDQHKAPITGVVFTQNTNAVVTCSKDGTVRAFDCLRYRNFRTFTQASNDQVALSSVAVDPAGEIVCAGGVDKFEIFVWSMQTGKLLDIISGHEGPINALEFHPLQPILFSGSWDKTVRIWDIFESRSNVESLSHSAEVVAMSLRQDGKQLIVSTADGKLNIWDTQEGNPVGEIEGKRDIAGSLKRADLLGKFFSGVRYTSDGTCAIASGNNGFVFIYHIAQRVLIKKYKIGDRLSIGERSDGSLNEKSLEEDEAEVNHVKLPGVKQGDLSERRVDTSIKISGLALAPSNRTWAVASNEGLLLYSLDQSTNFDPYDLDIDITPINIEKASRKGQHLKALIMSFRLNEKEIIGKVLEKIPVDQVQLLCANFPENFVTRLLNFIGDRFEKSPHLEFHLLWILNLFKFHGHHIQQHASSMMSLFRIIQRNVTAQHQGLSKLTDENMYTLSYLSTPMFSEKKDVEEMEE